jgi:coenzyme PQQ biosynthesis protein PqqD
VTERPLVEADANTDANTDANAGAAAVAAVDDLALSAASRPRLARKARLRTDRRTGETLLLYPEHGLVLNPSAAAILRLCDGRSAGDIAGELAAPLADVLEFLAQMRERGLVIA